MTLLLPLLLSVLLLSPQDQTQIPEVSPAAKIRVLKLQRDMNAIQAQILSLQAEWTDLKGQLTSNLKQLEREGYDLSSDTLTYSEKPKQ